MAFLTRRTASTPALLLIPLRSLALALGLTHCGYAVSEGATVGGATDLAFGLFLGFAAVAPLRLAIPAFAYLFVTTLFLRIRALADETGLPAHYDYPVVLDEFIFLGTVPNVWLQELLYVPGRMGPIDVALAAVYFSYFAMPTFMALFLWKVRPALFPRYTWALILTLAGGIVLYLLVPTAPPWLASDAGRIGTVERVIPAISAALAGDVYEQAAANLDQNAVAAMPSLHTAVTVITACVLAQFGRRWARAGIAYVAAMCLALVYLGEHYVVDELAGIALALGAWQATAYASLIRKRRDRLEPTSVGAVAGERERAGIPDVRRAA